VLTPLLPASLIDHRLPAGAQHERCDALKLAKLTSAQPFESHEQHILHEISRGMHIAQVL